eukprot:6212165-Pleurochrysis_carterae.AAC.2
MISRRKLCVANQVRQGCEPVPWPSWDDAFLNEARISSEYRISNWSVKLEWALDAAREGERRSVRRTPALRGRASVGELAMRNREWNENKNNTMAYSTRI